MSDQNLDEDPNVSTSRQVLVKSIEKMIRKSGDVYLLMELDQVCILGNEKERFEALFALKQKIVQR